MQKLKDLLAKALDIREAIQSSPANYSVGLCRLLLSYDTEQEVATAVNKIFERWPESDGRIGYPVPAPKDYVQPSNEIYGYDPRISAYYNLPKYTGEYGAARLRLLDFIIAELEKLTCDSA
jgi:hypothetical protein